MSGAAAFGAITFTLGGERVAQPGGGKLEGYEWWQARGFDASFELLDARGRPAEADGRLAFLVHRLGRVASHVADYAPDLSGLEDARTRADREHAGHDFLFYDLRIGDATAVPAGIMANGIVTVSQPHAVVWWPAGTETYCRFRIWAWFVPDAGPIVFDKREVDLYWADAPSPIEAQPQG